MVVLGIDAHKRTHTVVAVDETGGKLGERTLGTTTADHLAMLTLAERFAPSDGGRRRTVDTYPGVSSATWSARASASCASRPSSWRTPATVPAATASPTRSRPSAVAMEDQLPSAHSHERSAWSSAR